jgi:ATP-dependent DNA ligase
LPTGPDWQYEPKWDGFRGLAFRDGKKITLQSKSGKPLTRYFPELVAALLDLSPRQFVLDGEIVIPLDGSLSFDHLLMRIHPAPSRILKLSQSTPALSWSSTCWSTNEGSPLLSSHSQSAEKNSKRSPNVT